MRWRARRMVRGLKPLLADDGGHAIEALIINALLVMMAVVVRRASRRSRNLFCGRRARRHLQLPDGHRAGGHGRGGRGDDRGLGRRRHFHRAACWARCTCATARRPSRAANPGCRCCVSLAWARMLVYGTLGLPEFSDPKAPIHPHVVPRYLQRDQAGDRRAQRRDSRAGQLPRLRHAGRDDGGLHRRRRRGRAAAPAPRARTRRPA